MRWITNLAVALCVVLIAGLLVLAGYLTLSYAVEIAPYSAEVTQNADGVAYEISTVREDGDTNSSIEVTEDLVSAQAELDDYGDTVYFAGILCSAM